MEKYCRSTQIIDGELDNNQIMMHLEQGKYFGLNPVGKRIWELIETPKSLQEITKVLMLEFDVTEEICTNEVIAFLDKTIKHDVVVKYE